MVYKNQLKKFLDKYQISTKFASDVSWNVVSFGFMGVSGILLNVLIAKFYNTSTLGIFNQVYALYILFSQLAIAGIHLSVLKNISHYNDKPDEVKAIFSAAIYLVSCISIVVIFIAIFSRSLWIHIFKSPGVELGFLYVLPALLFFALNKTYLAFHNACRRMKVFAAFQSLRFFFFLFFLTLLICLSYDGNKIPIIFLLSELTLFLILFFFSLRFIRFSFSSRVLTWIKNHFLFGTKALFGHLLADVNTRVDVLMLGVFVSDKIVGIYSFAAMLADGFNQLPIVFRSNVNPVITRYRFSKNIEELEAAIKKGKRLAYKFLIPLGVAATIFYPLILHIFRFQAEFSILFNSWGIFAILMAGTLLSAGYLPFQMMLNQVGHPGYHTIFLFLVFTTNIVLNLILISIFGMYGAAVATALAISSQIIYLKILVRKKVNINI